MKYRMRNKAQHSLAVRGFHPNTPASQTIIRVPPGGEYVTDLEGLRAVVNGNLNGLVQFIGQADQYEEKKKLSPRTIDDEWF